MFGGLGVMVWDLGVIGDSYTLLRVITRLYLCGLFGCILGKGPRVAPRPSRSPAFVLTIRDK